MTRNAAHCYRHHSLLSNAESCALLHHRQRGPLRSATLAPCAPNALARCGWLTPASASLARGRSQARGAPLGLSLSRADGLNPWGCRSNLKVLPPQDLATPACPRKRGPRLATLGPGFASLARSDGGGRQQAGSTCLLGRCSAPLRSAPALGRAAWTASTLMSRSAVPSPGSARLGEQVPLRRVLRLRLRRRSLTLVVRRKRLTRLPFLSLAAVRAAADRPPRSGGVAPSARRRTLRPYGRPASWPAYGPGALPLRGLRSLRAWMPPMRQGFAGAP